MKNGWDGSYAGVYDSFGLLGERTILAHCVSFLRSWVGRKKRRRPAEGLSRRFSFVSFQVHLEETELQIIRATESGVSHCPTSNLNLRSGTPRIGDMLHRGIKVSPLPRRVSFFSAFLPLSLRPSSGSTYLLAHSPRSDSEPTAREATNPES